MGLERLNPLARHTNAVEGSMEVISQSHVACDFEIMAKATRTRRRIHSRRIRARPYKSQSSNGRVASNVFAQDCTKCLEKRDYENVICSVCMECPHNAVKGWTIVQPARDFLNLKQRICMQGNCVFAGSFRELRKHMKTDHPCAKPREVDPDVELNWRRLEIEQDRADVISTIRSMMPGATVFGDYVIETNNPNGSESCSEKGRDHHAGFGRNLWSVIIMMHGLRALRNQTRLSDSDSNDLTTHHGTSEMTVS
ncbi:hypothetical protein Bca4012_049625 [Brassica carinata]